MCLLILLTFVLLAALLSVWEYALIGAVIYAAFYIWLTSAQRAQRNREQNATHAHIKAVAMHKEALAFWRA